MYRVQSDLPGAPNIVRAAAPSLRVQLLVHWRVNVAMPNAHCAASKSRRAVSRIRRGRRRRAAICCDLLQVLPATIAPMHVLYVVRAEELGPGQMLALGWVSDRRLHRGSPETGQRPPPTARDTRPLSWICLPRGTQRGRRRGRSAARLPTRARGATSCLPFHPFTLLREASCIAVHSLALDRSFPPLQAARDGPTRTNNGAPGARRFIDYCPPQRCQTLWAHRGHGMGSRGAPGRPGTGASSRPNRANAGLLGCWARGRQYSKKVIRRIRIQLRNVGGRRRTSDISFPRSSPSSTAPHGALAAAKLPSLRRPPSSRLAPRRRHLLLCAQPGRAVVRAPALVTQHAERREAAKETQADDGHGHDRGGVRCVAGCCAKKGAFPSPTRTLSFSALPSPRHPQSRLRRKGAELLAVCYDPLLANDQSRSQCAFTRAYSSSRHRAAIPQPAVKLPTATANPHATGAQSTLQVRHGLAPLPPPLRF